MSIGYSDNPKLFINELLASNASNNLDPDLSDFCDWIEIYNSEDTVVNIEGYYITDNLSDPFKFQFPNNSIIQPNDYFVVWADGEDYYPGNYHIYPEDIDIVISDNHTNFKLNKSGDEVGLFNADGDLIDSIIFDQQITDISYGRKPNGSSEWFYFSNPSSLASNMSIGYLNTMRISSPQFSITGGFYTSSQIIELTSSNAYETIYFTLDGSKPTINSNIYTLPIIINSTSVIRAQAFGDNILPSVIATNTYFIDETSTLPVISIATDPELLWDDQIGIHTEGTNGTILHGDWGSREDLGIANYFQDWERPISLEYYEPSGNIGFHANAGIKIHGGWSRKAEQKSLTIHFRDKYGSENIDYILFHEKSIQSFNTFMLRNSGSDALKTRLRDGMMQTIVASQIDIDRQSYQPSVIFINGEYWGILNIRERTNSHYMESNYNLDSNELDILGCKYGRDYVINGSMSNYNEMINFAQSNDLTIPIIFDEIESLVDINELLNYQISQIYFANNDWLKNNYKLWKPNTENSKWRWILMDLDAGFGLTPGHWGDVTQNTINWATTTGSNGYWGRLPFRLFLINESFKYEFIQRFSTYLNTIFYPTRVIDIIDSLMENIELEIPRHFEKFPGIIDLEWEDQIDNLSEFAIDRPHYVRQHIIDYFALNGTRKLIVNVSAPGSGRIRIHDINIQSFPDTGIYFMDIPIRLTAIANEGYQFVNWQGISGEISNPDSIALILMGDSTITAIFADIDECATDNGGCGDATCVNNEGTAPTCSELSLFDGLIPEDFNIHSIYPNPFNPVTNIIYGLPEHVKVQIIVYDLSGRQIETLMNGFQTPGYHSVNWNADNLPSGVYLIRMDSGDFTQTQKVMLVK